MNKIKLKVNESLLGKSFAFLGAGLRVVQLSRFKPVAVEATFDALIKVVGPHSGVGLETFGGRFVANQTC